MIEILTRIAACMLIAASAHSATVGVIGIRVPVVTVREHQPIGSVVTIVDVSSTAAGIRTCTFVPGVGDADNGRFSFQGCVLRTALDLDHLTTPTCSIRFRADDGAGSSVEAVGTITVSAPPEGHVLRWGGDPYGGGTISVPTEPCIDLFAGSSSISTNPAGIVPDVVSMSISAQVSITLMRDGTVSTTGGLTVPAGLHDVIGVSAGMWHVLALRANGTVVAFGRAIADPSALAVPAGLTDAIAVAAGNDISLALTADHRVVAWGRLGSPAWTDVTAIAAGDDYGLALHADGTVSGWGNANNGRLAIPSGLDHVIAICANSYSAVNLALRDDGTAATWGVREGTQLDMPSGLTHILQLAVGRFDSFVLHQMTPPPADLALSPASVPETATPGTVVGQLSGMNPAGHPLLWTMIDSAGGRFAVSGSSVVVAGPLDAEVSMAHVITVSARDPDGLPLSFSPTIAVLPVSEFPTTDVSLLGSAVAENQPPGTVIGTFAPSDLDAGETFTYSLVDDAGGRFAVVGNQLQTTQPLDFEEASSYPITVRVADSGGSMLTKAFTITVTDLIDPGVVAFADQPLVIQEGDADHIIQLLVTRTLGSTGIVTVRLAQVAGTAIAGTDYLIPDPVAVFPDGTTSVVVAMRIHGDITVRTDRSLTLRLVQPTGCTIGANDTLATTIAEDDHYDPSIDGTRNFICGPGSGTAAILLTLGFMIRRRSWLWTR